MPLIPDLQFQAGRYEPATPSVASAMAPGLAMARVGASLQGAGEAVGEIQAIHDEGVKAQARIEMQTAYNEHAQFRAENADETSWGEHAAKTTESAWKRIEKLRMSPAMQAEVKSSFDGWGQNFQAGVKLDATKQTVAAARQRVSNAYEAALQAGRFNDARTSVQSSKAFSPVEKEKILLGINDREKDYQRSEGVRQAINLGAADPDWFNKHPAGQDIAGHDSVASQQIRRGIMSLRAGEADEFASKIEDMIAVGVTDEQITQLGKDQRPSVVAVLVKSNQRRHQENFEAERRTPGFQAALVGAVRNKMLRYEPTNEETFDSDRAEISGMIRQLPEENPIRGELASNLAALKSGKQEEVRTAAQAAQKALDEHVKTTVLDKLWDGDSGMPTQKAINDRFLQSADKLVALGYSPAQVAPIVAAKTDPERVNLFKDSWEQRSNKNAHPGGLVEATALAIVNGKAQIRFSTSEDTARAGAARTAAETRWGSQKIELAQWLKVYPKATAPEIETKLLKLTGTGIHVATAPLRSTPRPGSPASSDLSILSPTIDQTPTGSAFGVTTRTRETAVATAPGARNVSLDFNDTSNPDSPTAHGVKIVIPDDASEEEMAAAEAYTALTVKWFASKGVKVPNLGVSTTRENGRGVPGAFHTEPFFIGDQAAHEAVRADPDGYARILADTLGKIPGVTFIAPHKEKDGGAERGNVNERDFARSVLLPALSKIRPS